MIRHSFICLALGLMLSSGTALSEPPPLPERSGYGLLPGFGYSGDAEARAVWRPMNDTASVSVVQPGPRPVLHLPCNLADTTMERASWDWSVRLDLTCSRGIQFRFYCADPSPVSHFNVYVRSGKGWYAATFSAQERDAWNTVRIAKTATWIEDTPSGWAMIDLVRVSAWRGRDADTACYIADFGVWEGDAPVAILRQESAIVGKHADLKSITKFAQLTAGLLDDLGLPYMTLSDLDLEPERLRGIELVVLPYCPDLSNKAVDTLVAFLKSGGRMVSFYTLPRPLATAVDIGLGSHIKQTREGQFASIRAAGGGLTGMPATVAQKSWNISEARPVHGKSVAAAHWYDDAGTATGYAAIVVSKNAVHMTHILLEDDRANKRLLLLAMIGHFLPECWEQAAKQSLAQAGAIGPYADFRAAAAGIRLAAGRGNAAALRELASAESLRADAASLLQSGKHPEAIEAAGNARRALLMAYCSVQKPLAGEHRAFWCHSAFGVSGMTWDEAIQLLDDNGFTAILPNMLWGGSAFYDSEVLPVAPEVAEKGDQIAQCVAACRKYGVACHVWKVNWNMGWSAPPEFMKRMKEAGRTQVMFDGTREGRWLCPSHPANQQLEIDAMVEVARKYDVDGVHFDYIRYPHDKACFCPGCRARFEKAVGAKLAKWPADLRSNPGLEQRWLEFRRRQITTVVAAVAQQVRAIKPNVKVSAAVFRNWPRDRDTIGQDWKLWCDKGYLDFVCPMDYTPHNTQFETMVRQQLGWVGDVPCYPGIGMSVWPDAADIVKLIEQIGIARRLGTGGFTIFNYAVSAAQDMVPLCGKGITRK